MGLLEPCGGEGVMARMVGRADPGQTGLCGAEVEGRGWKCVDIMPLLVGFEKLQRIEY